MELIPWILFVVAAIAAFFGFTGQAQSKKRYEATETKLRGLESELESAKKQRLAVPAGAGNVPAIDPNALADSEKRLNSTLAEMKRLEVALQEAEKRTQSEREKAESALSKVAATEAMVAQARSKAAEAGHSAVQEAKKETEAVRAELSDVEKRLAMVAAGESRINELVTQAKNAQAEVAASVARSQALQAETEALQTRLSKTEDQMLEALDAVTLAKAESEKERQQAIRNTEKALQESFDAQLRQAKITFERDLETRLSAERERFESEQRRLALELETARLDAARLATIATKVEEAPAEEAMPIRPRPRPISTKTTDIGGEEEKPLVILADSDANALKTISKHLEAGGYLVQTAATMTEAIDAARKSAPVALALDGSNLPDGDCWKALATVKEDAELKEIPVLVFAPGKDKERAMEMGAAGCFAKPVDKAVLVATIKAAMVKRKQRARLAAVTSGTTGPRRSSLLTSPTQ